MRRWLSEEKKSCGLPVAPETRLRDRTSSGRSRRSHARPAESAHLHLSPPGWRGAKYLSEYGSYEVLQVQGMLGNRLEEFEAATINGCHVARGETADVGSDASRLNTNNNIRPFE